MALGTFDDLKAAVTRWSARSDVAGDAEDFIMLGEAGLNRELQAVETEATLTGIIGSRSIDISAHSVVRPRSLFLTYPDIGDEVQLTPKADGTFPYIDDNGEPELWSVDGDNIKFDRPLDQEYSFRFEFSQRFALSDAAPTNWLLTNHPDVYLAAVLIWGGLFTRNDTVGSRWAAVLNTGVPSVRGAIAQKKRALLTVDPALSRMNRRYVYNGGEIF